MLPTFVQFGTPTTTPDSPAERVIGDGISTLSSLMQTIIADYWPYFIGAGVLLGIIGIVKRVARSMVKWR
jgi:hypothetical protein